MPDFDPPPPLPPKRPLLRPWVSAVDGPALRYVDAGGRLHVVRLDALDLAHLQLSIAEALVHLSAPAR